MAITFVCTCGKTLRVADEHAGRRVQCPTCRGATTVPAAAPAIPTARLISPKPPPPPPRPTTDDFEILEDDEPPPKPKKKSASWDDEEERPKKRPQSARRDEDDDYEERPKKKSSRRAEDDEEDEPRPKKKKRRGTKAKKSSSEPSAGMRLVAVFGGLIAVLLGFGLLYVVFFTDADRKLGKALYLAILLILGGGGTAINGVTGDFGEDE